MHQVVPGETKALKEVECNLRVTQAGDQVRVDYIGTNFIDRVVIPVMEWRQFCKRQLEIPPPLPKQGVKP